LLSLFFGSDIYSAATTLSVFMGGLALGSWLASRYADRLSRPLLVYGLCEVLVSLSALLVPRVLNAFHGEYQHVYISSFDRAPWMYHGVRPAVAIATLLVPTTLMGATLPLLVRTFARRLSEIGREAGELYATNTFGALFGTIAGGFALLPMGGVTVSVAIMAGLGLVMGSGRW
jgi:spermidine synthase